MPTVQSPERTAYYLAQAVAVAARAECLGQAVGCVIVRGNRVVANGYNGAPEGWGNCSDGNVCPRCDKRKTFGSGNGYDKCICVHAEQNALTSAARHGNAVGGATAYVTRQPCISCAKLLVQAGIERVYYMISLPASDPDPELDALVKDAHVRLMGQLEAVAVHPEGVVAALRQSLARFESAAVDAADASACDGNVGDPAPPAA